MLQLFFQDQGKLRQFLYLIFVFDQGNSKFLLKVRKSQGFVYYLGDINFPIY